MLEWLNLGLSLLMHFGPASWTALSGAGFLFFYKREFWFVWHVFLIYEIQHTTYDI